MTNEELIDKIKAEIERQKKENINYDENGDFASYCDSSAWSALDSVLTFVSDLEKSKMPRKCLEKMELEKEIEDAWERLEKDYSPSALDKTTILVSGLVGEKQFSKIAHHFADWQKEKMLNDAVEGEVRHCATTHYVKPNEVQLTERLKQFQNGDEVRVIILPKED